MWFLRTRPIVLLLCSPPGSSTVSGYTCKKFVHLADLSTAISSAKLTLFENGSIAERGLRVT